MNDDEIILKYTPYVEIKNGFHTGKIIDVYAYKGKFNYLLISIKPLDIEIHGKYKIPILTLDFPLILTLKNNLGRFLIKSGFDITVKTEYTLKNIKELILNRTILFKTYTDVKEGCKYSEIDKETIEFV